MKRITQTKEIKTGDNSGVIFSGDEKASYSETFALNEYENNELITYAATVELIGANIPQTNSIMPWQSDIPTNQDNYVTHQIGSFEYMFRSNVDANISEPSLSGSTGSWIKTDIFGPIISYDNISSYNIGEWVTGDFNSKIYESKVNGNTGNLPSGGITDTFWKFIGNYRGYYNVGEFNLNDVVLDGDDSNRIYISNKAENTSPLSDIVGASSWQLVGVKDVGAQIKNGIYSTTDAGQVIVLIAHGLGAIPTSWNVKGQNLAGKNVVNISNETADSTNIILTPEFMNDDGQTLNFLWQAFL